MDNLENKLTDFVEYGYFVIENAFDPTIAKECREVIWADLNELGIYKHDLTTWVEKVPLGKSYDASTYPWSTINSPKLQFAIDTLIGSGTHKPFNYGWWMITFPGFEQHMNMNTAESTENTNSKILENAAANIPHIYNNSNDNPNNASSSCSNNNSGGDNKWKAKGSWHIDGHYFQHTLCGPEIGLIAIMLFSDIPPDGGGTAVAEGSHIIASKILSQINTNTNNTSNSTTTTTTTSTTMMSNTDLAKAVMSLNLPLNIVELTGKSGDIILLHPLLLHARSTNLNSINESGIRFMCHPSIRLSQPLNFYHTFENMTMLEKTMVLGAMLSLNNNNNKDNNHNSNSVDDYSFSSQDIVNIIQYHLSTYMYISHTTTMYPPHNTNQYQTIRQTSMNIYDNNDKNDMIISDEYTCRPHENGQNSSVIKPIKCLSVQLYDKIQRAIQHIQLNILPTYQSSISPTTNICNMSKPSTNIHFNSEIYVPQSTFIPADTLLSSSSSSSSSSTSISTDSDVYPSKRSTSHLPYITYDYHDDVYRATFTSSNSTLTTLESTSTLPSISSSSTHSPLRNNFIPLQNHHHHHTQMSSSPSSSPTDRNRMKLSNSDSRQINSPKTCKRVRFNEEIRIEHDSGSLYDEDMNIDTSTTILSTLSLEEPSTQHINIASTNYTTATTTTTTDRDDYSYNEMYDTMGFVIFSGNKKHKLR